MTWKMKRALPKAIGTSAIPPDALRRAAPGAGNTAAAEAANAIIVRLDSLMKELTEKKGIAQKKTIGYSSGLMPEEAVTQAKAIVDMLASAYSRHGIAPNELKQAYDALDRMIHDTLPFSGLKGEPFTELKRYAYEKLDKPLLVSGVKQLTGEAETLTASVRFFIDINADLQNFRQELSRPTTHLTEQQAIARAKSFVDRLAIGARKFSMVDDNVISANGAVANFVTDVMPAYGLSRQGLQQIMAYVTEKLDPANLK